MKISKNHLNFTEKRIKKKLVMNELESGFKLNALMTSPVEGREHFMEKARIFKELRDLGDQVVSECMLKKGGRPDLIDLDRAEIHEIIHTENDRSIEEKRRKYPTVFKIITHNAQAIKKLERK